ncbi:MAG: helix-turn-helix domain-containing protein [Clostridia bacterium]|nr:helix-turn-helix domain-containing protein [Clostridia bacterium]
MTVRELREKLGVTQDVFARTLGVSASLIAGIETGRKVLTEQMAGRINALVGDDWENPRPIEVKDAPMDPVLIRTSERIRMLRGCFQMTRKQFADAFGGTMSTLAHVEDQDRAASDKWLQMVSDTFHVSLKWLRGEVPASSEMPTYEGREPEKAPLDPSERVEEDVLGEDGLPVEGLVSDGRAVYLMRTRLGLSQKAMVEKFQLSGSTISLVELGKLNLSERLRSMLEEAYGPLFSQTTTAADLSKKEPVQEESVPETPEEEQKPEAGEERATEEPEAAMPEQQSEEDMTAMDVPEIAEAPANAEENVQPVHAPISRPSRSGVVVALLQAIRILGRTLPEGQLEGAVAEIQRAL